MGVWTFWLAELSQITGDKSSEFCVDPRGENEILTFITFNQLTGFAGVLAIQCFRAHIVSEKTDKSDLVLVKIAPSGK